MGAYCSREKPPGILIQGLDAAGKTTLLYKKHLGEVVTTIPTIGFNIENVSVNGYEITCWDVGGRDKIRPLIRHYYHGMEGNIFVIDSHDVERMDDALDQINTLVLKEELTENKVLMVLANKQDMEGALPVEKIEEKVKKLVSSQSSLGGRCIFVHGCSATTNEGVEEAFSLFIQQIKRQRQGKITPGFTTPSSLQAQGEIAQNKDGSSRFHFLKKMFDIPYVKSILFY